MPTALLPIPGPQTIHSAGVGISRREQLVVCVVLVVDALELTVGRSNL